VGNVPELGESIPNKSSFTRARRRLGPRVLETMFRELAGPLAPVGLKSAFYREMRLAAVDGFVMDVPDTLAKRAAFGGPVNSHQGWGELSSEQVQQLRDAVADPLWKTEAPGSSPPPSFSAQLADCPYPAGLGPPGRDARCPTRVDGQRPRHVRVAARWPRAYRAGRATVDPRVRSWKLGVERPAPWRSIDIGGDVFGWPWMPPVPQSTRRCRSEIFDDGGQCCRGELFEVLLDGRRRWHDPVGVDDRGRDEVVSDQHVAGRGGRHHQ
jgi:hypothetical protein